MAGFVGVVALDQLSKALVVSHLAAEGATRLVAGDVVRITLAYNTGTLFRHLLPFLSPVLVYGVLFAAVALLLVRHGRARPVATIRWGVVLILGGATGNLVDQIGFGRVVDFLSVGLPGLAWRVPTFNLADVAICSGAVLLACGELGSAQPTPSFQKGNPVAGSRGARPS